MKIVNVICLLAFMCGVNSLIAQHSIDFEISDIEEPGIGTIYVMLFDSAEGFPLDLDSAYKFVEITEFSQSVKGKFEKIPTGLYAISLFQDKNGNREIDRNFIKMPKEPVGALNKTSIGKPTFTKSSIDLKGDVVLNLQFMIQ